VVDGVRVLEGDDGGRRSRVKAQLERCRPRVRQQALLEGRVDPGARDELRAVGGIPRDEPVDPRADCLALDDALLDEQLLERPRAGCCRQLADWELLTDALLGTLAGKGLMNVDELRRGIESMPTEAYEHASYYERWLYSIETILAEKGVLRAGELDAKVAT
jgi:hypothetical protein